MKRIGIFGVFALVAVFGACVDDSTEGRTNDSETGEGEGEGEGVGDSDTESEGQGGMQGGCDQVPSVFSEAAAFVLSRQSGKVIRYTAFHGLVEGHASAQAVMDLTLWAGYGATLAAGTMDLGGDNTSFATCSTCLVYSQGVLMNPEGVPTFTDHKYMPSAGTLTVKTLDPKVGGLFKFSLDAEMIEVSIDDTSFETLPLNDGCSFSFEGYVATATLK